MRVCFISKWGWGGHLFKNEADNSHHCAFIISHACSSFQENKVTGRKADVLIAAYTAAEAALRLVRPGNEVRHKSVHRNSGINF